MRLFTIETRDNFDQFLAWRREWNQEHQPEVEAILAAVRAEGDQALCRLTAQFDGISLEPGRLRVSPEEIAEAYQQVDSDFLSALSAARRNLEEFQRSRLPQDLIKPDPSGNLVGHLCRPLFRVGVYVPGGTAAYPSSVLMNVIPAKVAGVAEIVMVTPPASNGGVNPYILVAAAEAGVTEIYRVGGAQAVAALAYGTGTIKAVDKITGPGNIYVATAKRLVYGLVDIDMVAGPSEIVIVADSEADPVYLAADLLSQAEHDRDATAVLITTDESLVPKVIVELDKQMEALVRRDIARASWENRGAIAVAPDLDTALDLANSLAPEHLELMVAEPWRRLNQVRNAGAVFLGSCSPEPVGDYWAGPNHILPTGGTARFASALGVEDFIKRISVISYTAGGIREAGAEIIRLAEAEGLTAHAEAVRKRLGDCK